MSESFQEGFRQIVKAATAEDLELFGRIRDRECPEGRFIADGARVVKRVLQRGAAEKVLCTPEWAEKLSIHPDVDIRVAPKERLDSIVGYRLHQGLMALGRIPDPGPIDDSLLVAFDGVDNSENVGAIMRTCAAFGATGVLVGSGSVSPWIRRAFRVSMAAPLEVPAHFVEDLPGALRSRNAYAAHIHGDRKDYIAVDWKGPSCVVLGGEDRGVSQRVLEACRGVVMIPMAQRWDCLNVAASAAVLLAEIQRQRSV